MTDATQPSTATVVAAFAGALLPLAGPVGIAASTLIPAAEQLLDMFRADPAKNYTVDDLAGIVTAGNAALAKLQADVAALGAGT